MEELGKLLIDPLDKINIFFFYDIGQKEKRHSEVLIGWVVGVKKALEEKTKEIFSIIYFINIFSHSKANIGAK